MIYDTIAKDETVLKTLEVGCAIGFSSLAITSALKGRPNAHHTIIDPFQISMFDRAGIDLLESKGIKHFDLIENGSQIALPNLLDKSEIFDLILIDGFHSFEQAMLDIFYSTRLLRQGGYLVVDDSSWPAVAKSVAYYENQPWLKLHDRPKPIDPVSAAIWKILGTRVLRKIAVRVLPNKLMHTLNVKRFGTMVILKMVSIVDQEYYRYHFF